MRDDQEVRMTVELRFLVAGYMDDPEDLARRLVDEKLQPLLGSEYDWGGRFIIATDIETTIGGVTT